MKTPLTLLEKPLLDQVVDNLTFATTENPQASITDWRGKILVLYFYPKDNTPGCTLESKEFRDLYPHFVQASIEILGISRDNLKSHHKFKTQCELPFSLISDEAEVLCQYFGVMKEKNMYGKKVRGIERSTFLIDQHGVLRQEWRNVKVPGHAQAVLEAAQSILS